MKSARLARLVVLTFVTLSSANFIFAQKMKAEDILAKHLDSIGTTEARQTVKNQVAVGDAQVNYISNKTAPLAGRIVIATAGGKNFLGMKFNSTNYPSEKFSYDGKKAKVGFAQNGLRSPFGNFVLTNNSLLEDGLLSGTLSNSWTLLDLTNRKGKLSYGGTKKINGKDAYVLDYSPKGGSDVDINLYFDKENFRHIRTEYKRISSAGIGAKPEDSSRYSESRITLTEDFSDFKPEGNLTLPHNYRVLYSASTTSNGTIEIEWTFKLSEFAFNQNLAANTFDIGAVN